MSEFIDNVFEHMGLQKRLMGVCGVFELPKNEQLEVTLLNIAGESIEAMGFVLDKTKPWKESTFNIESVKEEVIDVYHFWLQFIALYNFYHSVNERDCYVDYVSSDIECMKSALRISGSQALAMLDFNNEMILKWFAIDQWERFLTIFFCLKMTPEEVDSLYRTKNKRNFERIKEKLSGSD